MLTLAPYTATHVALLGTYPYRDRLKALDLYPDLRFDSDERCWLLDLRTLPMLYSALGDAIAPMSPEFWLTLPVPGESNRPNPKRRRRQTYQERQEERERAGEVGRAVVGMKGALP